MHTTIIDLVFGSLLITATLAALFPLVDQFADLLPLAVQLLLFILPSFDATRFSTVGHFNAELKGGLGQSFPTAHILAVLLLSVEVPTTHGTFLVALYDD